MTFYSVSFVVIDFSRNRSPEFFSKTKQKHWFIGLVTTGILTKIHCSVTTFIAKSALLKMRKPRPILKEGSAVDGIVGLGTGSKNFDHKTRFIGSK